MNNLRNYEFFLTTVRHQNFANAARELGVSPSTVAKGINRLEESLGITLFIRNTRHVILTPEGQDFQERFQKIASELEDLENSLQSGKNEAKGILKISAPITLGRTIITSVIAKLAQSKSNLQFDLRLSDEYVDIVQDGYDAALRIGSLSDSRLLAKKLGTQKLVVCGSPKYLEKKGIPEKPTDIHQHECALFRMPTTSRDRPWSFQNKGKELVITPFSRIRMDEGEALVQLAIQNVGLIQVPDYMVRTQIKKGTLVEVLKPFAPNPMQISIVFANNKNRLPRLRLFIEELEKAFKES